MSVGMRLNWINRQNSPARSIALGTFDGVHLGHQKLLEETIARKPAGGTSCVFTFDIPPEQYFRGRLRLVSSFERRVELFRSSGIDEVTWLTFGPDLTTMAAEDFVGRILVHELKAKAVICGYNYRFGSKRGGDVQYLQKQGEHHGFSVTVVPPVQGKSGQTISSTAIRQLLSEGDLAQASAYLGYYPTYEAAVGQLSIGSSLYLRIDPNLVLPGQGLYLIWCALPGSQGVPAIAWPVDEGIKSVFLDRDFELRAEAVDVQFLYKLRGYGPYQVTESDVVKARQLLPGFYLQDARVVLK